MEKCKAKMIFNNFSEMIGRTPMLKLPIQSTKWQLFLKLEKFNPGQSMKDRMALNMVFHAEQKGLLKKGGCIIESTSGNTGISLAMIAAERGYRFIAIVDHHAAKNKIAIMRAYGAEIVYAENNCSKSRVSVKEREHLAEKIHKKISNSFFPRQADNPDNSDGYYRSLGPEIISDTEGKITTLIGAVGTGGSLCGTAKYLKEYHPDISVIGVEPVGSVIFGGDDAPYYQSGTGTPGNVSIGKNVDFATIDQGVTVSDKEAFSTSRFLAKRLGVLIGGASGGVIYKALDYIYQNNQKGLMIAIVADGGEKYLDTVFNDKWMVSKSFIDPITNIKLARWIKH